MNPKQMMPRLELLALHVVGSGLVSRGGKPEEDTWALSPTT